MAKRGRPRKDGAIRDENGKIMSSEYSAGRRARTEERNRDFERIAHWQRAKLVIQTLVKEPKLESPIGRMFALGEPRAISAIMWEAAFRALNILEGYDRIVLNVQRNPQGIVIGETHGKSLADDPDDETVGRATEKLMRLESVLGQCKTPGVSSATKEALRGKEITSLYQAELIYQGLSALVIEFKLQGHDEKAIDMSARQRRLPGEEALVEPVRLSA
jgi:hypothetical protein